MSNHKGEETAGRAKEAVGDMTGDEKLKREGKLDQLSAATKAKLDEATDKIKDIVKPKHDPKS